MSKRFAWLLGTVGMVLIGLLLACGSNYNSSSDGLVLVGSQGSGLIETFSFNLNSGSVSAVGNTPTNTAGQTCVLNGIPSSIVVDPAGAYAYTIINANSACSTGTVPSTNGILAMKVNSDGTTTPGTQIAFNQANLLIQGSAPPTTEAVSVVPSTMTMDAKGKFLFVANRATTDSAQRFVPGSVSVFAIGNGGSVTEVTGSPFFASSPAMTVLQSSYDLISAAPSPTVFPKIGANGVSNSVCSAKALNPPTSEYLYAVDTLGNQVFQFAVDTSSGVLTNATALGQPPVATDLVPVGIAVDPCDRFVYVSNSQTARVSAYTICNGASTQSSHCPTTPDGSLWQVTNSPFSLVGSNSPGPLVVDPFGNFVYVVGTFSDTVSGLRISPNSGSLAALSPTTVATGQRPTSIAIRADDNWMFITNYTSGTISQYAIIPASGALTVQQATSTDNYPWGVAVK